MPVSLVLEEMVDVHTELVMECFVKLVDSFFNNGKPVYIQIDKVKRILLVGEQCDNQAVRPNAERARDILLKLGYFDVLDDKN